MTTLQTVALDLCDRCLDGEGGECHTPGCALWMNRAPDGPLVDKATYLSAAWEVSDG